MQLSISTSSQQTRFTHDMSAERVLLLVLLPVVLADPHEVRLYSKVSSPVFSSNSQLLDGLEPLERPVENSSSPVVVSMGVVLQQLISVDERNMLVEVNAWLKLVKKFSF